jgi:hypothetical protein
MEQQRGTGGTQEQGGWLAVALAWTAVGIPLAWGIFMTFKKAALLFK